MRPLLLLFWILPSLLISDPATAQLTLIVDSLTQTVWLEGSDSGFTGKTASSEKGGGVVVWGARLGSRVDVRPFDVASALANLFVSSANASVGLEFIYNSGGPRNITGSMTPVSYAGLPPADQAALEAAVGGPLPLTVGSGYMPLMVAEPPVPTESASWSRVKAIYQAR